MNKAHKKLLRDNFEKAVADYVAAFLNMYELDARYGYWVSDDMTGVYAYGDNHFLSLSNLIYIVDNNVPESTLEEWEEYCLWAHEFGQTIPNLDSWVKGCPRASKEQMEHLIKLKQDFDDAVQDCKGAF